MKIAIVAANGRVGKLVAEEAVKRGHDVTAVVREANKTAAPKSLVKDALALAPADLAGFDAVVDAVGGWTADTVGAIPAAAADELARFVTGRPDAAYAALGAAEKTKVHVVMSLLTQESGTAVFTAPALSLDPNGTTTTFSYGGGTQTRTFHLDRDAEGGITIRFKNTVRPTHLLVDLDAHPLGAGSELKGGYTLIFSAQDLDTLAQKDFARCDNDNAENTMRAIPPVPQKLIAAVDRLPADFRLDLAPDTTFSATLK